MITAIERIRNFGVFDNYMRPVDFEDFSELNLIYGWNYSGKTTLSRIFRSAEQRALHSDYSGGSFKISIEGGGHITESTLNSHNSAIRVFNADFVKDNLSWDGDSFEPILLLGEQSIEAQHEIDKNEAMLARLRNGYRTKQYRLEERERTLRDAKSSLARSIKQTLKLVEAYTATHLNQELTKVASAPETFVIPAENLNEFTDAATAVETDKLPQISLVNHSWQVDTHLQDLGDLLSQKPEMSNTIQYLVDHVDAANWVKAGIPLHEHSDKCEFCSSPLSASRMAALKGHFSEDMALLERRIKKKTKDVSAGIIKMSEIHPKDVYPAFRNALSTSQQNLKNEIQAHNDKLTTIIGLLERKLSAPFESITPPTVANDGIVSLAAACQELNDVIAKHNAQTDSFDQKKREALSKLKLHYAADFYITFGLSKHDALDSLISKHKAWFERVGRKLKQRNQELEAQINQAQKGKDELNSFMDKFLTRSNVAVDVVPSHEGERFCLLRNGKPAKNLSEGERTAIAYAFFLIKLKESANFEDLIVYLDDPVSSLDSNHLFQISAVTKEFFFWQDEGDQGKWKLKVRQLFVSTHNFEFLSLLKELPIPVKGGRRKYFFVKRMTETKSALLAMPPSIIRHNSEYQYLWSVIHGFHTSQDKSDLEVLLSLPNSLRRFVELYTYAKIPSNTSVDQRAKLLFGAEMSKRILKLLHHFSHSNNLLGISQNDDLICDIENVVDELIQLIQADSQHYDALMDGLK